MRLMTSTPSRSADLVIVGGTVEPMTEGAARAQAIAVADGRIAVIGTARDVRERIGPSTEVVELAGETVLPGFQDAHVHPIGGGMLADRVDLHALATAGDYLAAIADYAGRHPEREWITGSGWELTAFAGGEPDRRPLDDVVGDRPALLYSNDGHVAWASSRALERAEVTASTPDPADGRIVRDERGEPTGTLHDGAVHLVDRLIPEPTHEERVRGLLAAQTSLHGLGITAWQDASVEAPELAVYREVAADGRLTARVEAALWWHRSAGLDQIDWFEEARASASMRPRLGASTVKLMLDGILESRTALMVDQYEGGDGWRGVPFIEPELLRRAVVELDRRGFSCHFHAIGDGAVRLALDAVEAARAANGLRPGRHHVAHLEVIHPDDVPRFAALDVTANIQPLWAADDDQMVALRIPAIGEARRCWQYPFTSLAAAGARLAGGSDWSVTSPDPLREIEVAVRRVALETRDAAPLCPEERLTLDQALRAFTVGAAYVNHLDTETGTLEPGKLADISILDRNLRDPHAGPIGDACVRATYVGGVRVA
jgi:predicted amidohydrolase YtcJ